MAGGSAPQLESDGVTEIEGTEGENAPPKPEEKPEAPTVSIAVKPEDLDPALPSYVGTYAILTAGGVKGLPPPQPMMGMAPPPQQPNQPGHGGMSELAPRLNQHQLSESGENSGPTLN